MADFKVCDGFMMVMNFERVCVYIYMYMCVCFFNRELYQLPQPYPAAFIMSAQRRDVSFLMSRLGSKRFYRYFHFISQTRFNMLTEV